MNNDAAQISLEETAAQMKAVAETKRLAAEMKKPKRGRKLAPVEMATDATPPKRPGRPKGSKNRVRAKRSNGRAAVKAAIRNHAGMIREHARQIKVLERALTAL